MFHIDYGGTGFMKRSLIASLVLSAFASTVHAASFPSPAVLCPMIAATADEGNQTPAAWQKSGTEYFCLSSGMSSLGEGVVFMNAYQATGPSKARASSIHFRLTMYDSTLRTAQISQLLLPRITAVFAASQAGPVPDALVQAITNATSASVPTTLGVARTGLTLSSNTSSPNNGAVFEVEIDAP
jgi:hypothetical protein